MESPTETNSCSYIFQTSDMFHDKILHCSRNMHGFEFSLVWSGSIVRGGRPGSRQGRSRLGRGLKPANSPLIILFGGVSCFAHSRYKTSYSDMHHLCPLLIGCPRCDCMMTIFSAIISLVTLHWALLPHELFGPRQGSLHWRGLDRHSDCLNFSD